MLFPNYTKWEQVLITKHGISYSVIMKRQNVDTGLYQFKSVFIGEINEVPTLENINVLINNS